MNAGELVDTVENLGGNLRLDGNQIRYRLPAQAALLLSELRRQKPAILTFLKERERRIAFTQLLPFLGKRVWTPLGPGLLAEVEDYVAVEFRDGKTMRWYDTNAVIPYA